MQTLNLHTHDTLFFGDGKPFSMGEENIATGVFPPTPYSFYGLARSIYYHQNEAALQNWKQSGADKDDKTQDLKMNWIGLRRGADYYVPAPYHLVRPKGQTDLGGVQILTPEKKNFPSHIPLDYVLLPPSPDDQPLLLSIGGQGFLRWESLLALLEKGTIPKNKDWLSRSDAWMLEAKIGIGRELDNLSAREGRLFRQQRIRLYGPEKVVKDELSPEEDQQTPQSQYTELAMTFEGISPLPHSQGFCRFGGEGRTVAYTTTLTSPAIPLLGLTGRCFILYLSTPAAFGAGWWPGDDPTANPKQFSLQGIELELLAAASDKYQSIGGSETYYHEQDQKWKWRMRPMERMVPAGAVYYLRVLDQTPMDEVVAKLHGTAIATDPELARQGFGLAWLGNIDDNLFTT